MHRYTLPAEKPAYVILDLEHRDPLLEASIEVVGDREVMGVRRSRSWAGDQVVFRDPLLPSTCAGDGRIEPSEAGV